VDFRQRLENMAKASGMYAHTREGFLMHVLVLLDVVGVDTSVGSAAGDLMRLGVTDGPSNVIPIAHLLTPIAVPDDPWAKQVVAAALALLPEGSGRFVLTAEP
jgi:hypothetical protein